MTVLDICQDACRRINIEPITALFDSERDASKMFRGIIPDAVHEIVRRHDWQVLRREHTFTTTATEEQTAAFPSDFLRIVNNTAWNRDDQRRLVGPLTADEWQRLKATVSAAVFDQFTVRGDAMFVDPVPPAGQTWAFEYITNQPWEDTGGTGKVAVTADTDVFRLDDELLTLALVWQYRKGKGMDYAEEFVRYERFLAQLKAQERGGARNLHMDGRRWIDVQYPGVATPEGNWDLP